jgi:hypothetical protein
MSILSTIFSDGASKIVDSVGNAIDNLVTSDEEREKLKNELYKIQADRELEFKKIAVESEKLVLADVANAREMETKKNESQYSTWLSKNASSIYGGIVIILFFVFSFFSVFDLGYKINMEAFNSVFMAVYGMATMYGGYLWGASKAQKDVQMNIGK